MDLMAKMVATASPNSFARLRVATTRPSSASSSRGGSSNGALFSCRQMAYILTCFYIACLVVAFWSVSTLHTSHDLSDFASHMEMMNLETIVQELAGAPLPQSITVSSKTQISTSKSVAAAVSSPLAITAHQSSDTARIDDWYEPILSQMEHKIPTVQSCRRVQNTPTTGSSLSSTGGDQKTTTRKNRSLNADYYYSLDPLAACRTSTTTTTEKKKSIVYYNPHARPRILCGHELAANGGTLELDDQQQASCLAQPSRLFPVIPSVETAAQLAPTTLRFDRHSKAQPFPDCNIPCLSGGNFGVMGMRTVDGTPFQLHFSMEGPQYYSELKIRETAYQDNIYYSTTSFRSEVPLPYFSYAEYDIQNPQHVVDFHQAEKAAVFLARNCGSRNDREGLVKALQASPQFRIDSLSTCLHNAELPPGLPGLGNKNAVMHHYLFYLAFENQREDDYVTEKLWGPYEAGTVPIYFGAPNIKQLAPNRSYIDVDDFATPDDLARYLNIVAQNQTLYESYHTWRREPLPPHFTAKFNISKTHSTCRTCRWAFAKMYGLGWHHENQTITPELQSTARGVCLDNTGNKNAGIITRPFREVWLNALTDQLVIPDDATGVASTTISSCQEVNPKTRVIHLDHGRLKRTVWEQDGVVDIVLEYPAAVPAATSQQEAIQLQLRLETPLQEPAQMTIIREGQIRLQNSHSRFTLLTWPTRVANITQHVTTTETGGGSSRSALVLNLHQVAVTPLRLRLIVEDVDLFHKGADKLENYFGKIMIDDFFEPVEAFYRE